MNQSLEIVSFNLADKIFALLVNQTQQLLRTVALTDLGNLNQKIEGVFNYRGTLIYVVDIRLKMEIAAKPNALSDVLIILNDGDRKCAIRVDQILEHFTVSKNDILQDQIISRNGTLIPILDLHPLFECLPKEREPENIHVA